LAALGLLAAAPDAAADIVRLTNGRTLTVDVCRFDGEQAVLTLPGGGEIRIPRALVDELLPDELPSARPVAIEALARSPHASRPRLAPSAIRALIDEYSRRHGVDSRLAHAVVRAESNFNPMAVSPKGAMGLMQLMPATAREYGVTDPFDPAQNLDAGLRHLRGLLGRYDRSRALAAYNAGEGAVSRYGGVPPYRETQQYIRRILSFYNR
jgi:soluble lytic murein transglycosylase-like protein